MTTAIGIFLLLLPTAYLWSLARSKGAPAPAVTPGSIVGLVLLATYVLAALITSGLDTAPERLRPLYGFALPALAFGLITFPRAVGHLLAPVPGYTGGDTLIRIIGYILLGIPLIVVSRALQGQPN